MLPASEVQPHDQYSIELKTWNYSKSLVNNIGYENMHRDKAKLLQFSKTSNYSLKRKLEHLVFSLNYEGTNTDWRRKKTMKTETKPQHSTIKTMEGHVDREVELWGNIDSKVKYTHTNVLPLNC